LADEASIPVYVVNVIFEESDGVGLLSSDLLVVYLLKYSPYSSELVIKFLSSLHLVLASPIVLSSTLKM